MLQLSIETIDDDFEVETEAALDEGNHPPHIMAERRPSVPATPAGRVIPPMLYPPVHCHAQLIMPGYVLVDRAKLPLDHAWVACNARPKRTAYLPHETVVVITVPVLHLSVSQRTYELQVALRARTSLDQRAAIGNITAEAPAVVPLTPPHQWLSLLSAVRTTSSRLAGEP
jgi:hypothetical protein